MTTVASDPRLELALYIKSIGDRLYRISLEVQKIDDEISEKLETIGLTSGMSADESQAFWEKFFDEAREKAGWNV